MKLICPACGCTASADAWANDPIARDTILAIASLPAPLHLSTLRYISLFRPGKSALSWKKALKLVGEVDALAKAGYVSIQGQVDKDCPARIWAEAMDSMADRQGTIKRPLKSHSYLRQVAHGLATEYVKKQEDDKEQNASIRTSQTVDPDSVAEMYKNLSETEKANLPARIKEKYGL